MFSSELNEYGIELARMICLSADLHTKLVKAKADLQEYERSLFVVLVSDFYDEITFLEDPEVIIPKLDDIDFLDGLYSNVEDGVITFYDSTASPLITYRLSI